MDNTLAALSSPLPATKRGSAKVALIDLKDPTRNVLAECFRQFGAETVILNGDAEDRLRREKFEACVVHLGAGAGTIMEAVRTSPSNCHMIMYGLGGSVQDALSYSKYGVNAVFNEPLERPAALKLVRATQTLVFHEFRRYVRIPVITEVAVVTGDNHRFTVTSQEISSGGMSFRSPEDIPAGQSVEISFALLTLPRIWVRGKVTWRKPANRSIGIRFEQQDERRLRIKEWIEAYLES
jgi:Tfp pilus assembly protein PilZ